MPLGETTLGRTLAAFRKLAGIKQKELAKRIGVTPNYLSLVENDKREPSITTLLKISKEIKQPLSYIFWTAYEKPTTWMDG